MAEGVLVPALAAGADYLGNELYNFYESIGQPQEFAPPEYNDHPEDRQPFLGFARGEYDPDELTPRYIIPGSQAHAIGNLGQGAAMFLPQVPRPVVAGARLAANLVGYGPEVANFVSQPAFPLYSAAAMGAVYGFHKLYQAAKAHRDAAALKKLEAIAKKYPRVLGRTNFASPGNAQSQIC